MPNPIEPPAVFSVENIKGSPLSTVAAVLVAIATAIGNGAEVPHDLTGWLRLAGGIAIAVVLALLRGPQKVTTTTPLLVLGLGAALVSGGCSRPPDASPSTPGMAQIATLVVGGAGVACALGVPPEQRPAVFAGLIVFEHLLATDPATALTQAGTADSAINENAGMAYIWAVLHQWLDGLGTKGWDVYGATLLRQAVTACVQAIA